MLKRLVLIPMLLLWAAVPAQAEPHAGNDKRWTVEDVLGGAITPFAIGHRGAGENMGQDPTRPIENTTESVRRAFRSGAQIVEVDVVMTRDRIAVAMHDDFLSDFTCVNQLTFSELRHRFREASRLKHVLKVARVYSMKRRDERPSGQLILEIKTPAPLCDPEDRTIGELVTATLTAIDRARVQDQVAIESFSPEIVALVKHRRPGIPRVLSLDLVQLLTPTQIEAASGMPVTLLDKDVGLGLQWVQVGPLFRLPIYESPFEWMGTLVTLESRAAALGKEVLQQLESSNAGSGALLVQQLHNLGIDSLVYTVNSASQWSALAALGVDGIYTDDLAMGLALEGQ